jgi:cell division protease FtsH
VNTRKRIPLISILLVVGIAVLLAYFFLAKSSNQVTLSINQVADGIRDGSIVSISEDGNNLTITFSNGTQGVSTKKRDSDLIQQLIQYGLTPAQLSPSRIAINVKTPNQWTDVLTILGYLLPFILLAGMFFFIFRSARGSNNSAMSFGKSRARIVNSERPVVTFEDVAGVEEAREELKEVVEFLREPQKFISVGARIPKGVLLVGSPGTGKTLIAKAIAGEAGVPFFSISGSEFVEMFVGVGASRVRDLFDQAKRHAPCIIFIDEIDAVGRQRGAGLGGGNDEREQTLNQMLVEMDGFDTDTNVIVIAATNRPDVLDPALLRPGRFDRRVVMDRPDVRGREEILKVHTRGKPIDPSVNLSSLALAIPGFVGADIENLVNEAAILAARRGKKMITQAELEESIERVIAGPERKSRLINPTEKLIIAYHEAGHAVVMHAIPEADPVHKVTIVARGFAGGYTMPRPLEEHNLESRKRLLAELTGLMGGRTSEELVFDDITSGASNDIERATQIARMMVMRLGMVGEMGPMVYGKKEEMIFLGREISEQRDYSDAVSEEIDLQVRRLVNEAHQQARQILTLYRDKLDAVANRLVEVETLSQEEFEKIFPSPFPKVSGTPVML